MSCRRLIVASLGIGALLTLILLIAAAVWGVLNSVGDDQGAAAARGFLLITGVGWFLNFVALVILLACVILRTDPPPAAPADEPPVT